MRPRKKRPRDDLAGTYARIRKPVPPPQKVEEDRRRKTEKKEAERQVREELSEREEGG